MCQPRRGNRYLTPGPCPLLLPSPLPPPLPALAFSPVVLSIVVLLRAQVRSGYHEELDRMKDTLFALPEFLREVGKVRQLRYLAERAATLCRGPTSQAAAEPACRRRGYRSMGEPCCGLGRFAPLSLGLPALEGEGCHPPPPRLASVLCCVLAFIAPDAGQPGNGYHP